MSLIEGFSGTVRYAISNTRQLNFLRLLEQKAKGMESTQGLFFLARYGYDGESPWQDLLLDIQNLQKEQDNNRGNAVWGPGRSEVTTGNFYSDRTLAKSTIVDGVICEKKISLEAR